jgi:hypothetical protein
MSIVNSGPLSIHPGVVNGRRQYALESTAKPHKGGGKLGKKMKALAARRLAHSATLSRNPPAGAFKTPGSMNQHK